MLLFILFGVWLGIIGVIYFFDNKFPSEIISVLNVSLIVIAILILALIITGWFVQPKHFIPVDICKLTPVDGDVYGIVKR